ncbi:MAG: hypothetical protein OHK0013_20020 [Sandaracinaceae bacterium]
MVLAQVTYEPRVQPVLEDLLRSEGSEIYVKPLELYVPPGRPVTFEYLISRRRGAARRRARARAARARNRA